MIRNLIAILSGFKNVIVAAGGTINSGEASPYAEQTSTAGGFYGAIVGGVRNVVVAGTGVVVGGVRYVLKVGWERQLSYFGVVFPAMRLAVLPTALQLRMATVCVVLSM